MKPPKLGDLSDEEIRQLKWYYQIELRPGVFTDGRPHHTLGMVRRQIAGMDVAGQRCLDIGTQEGLVPTVLAGAGAKRVVAYDRLDLSDRLSLVRQAYGVEFDYQHSRELAELPACLAATGDTPFDIVIFAGVLYHMLDPLSGLALARSFVRDQGLLLLETSVVVSDKMALHLNAGGRYYPASNYFQITLGALDYLLRMLRLKVVDCAYMRGTYLGRGPRWLRQLKACLRGDKLCRVSVVCRAVDEPMALPGDQWMRRRWIENDFRAVSLDFDKLKLDLPAVGYRPLATRLPCHPQIESVDMFRTVIGAKPESVDPELAVLKLPV